MSKPEPRLQRKLLAWLLGPLALVLALDAGAAWWGALRFANLAYDRALQEIAREIVLHVKNGDTQPRLEMSETAGNILLRDADDRLFFRLVAEDGRTMGAPAAPNSMAPGCTASRSAWWRPGSRSPRRPVRPWCRCRSPKP
jgi:two-component system sensor histidine kinase TctE